MSTSMDKSPVRFAVGVSGFGIGIGCGVGIGIGKPVHFRGVPVLEDVVSGISTALNQLPFGISEICRQAQQLTGRTGIPNAGVGLGCGIGIGYGYGAGLLMTNASVKAVQRICQQRFDRYTPVKKQKLKELEERAKLSTTDNRFQQEITEIRKQQLAQKEAFCRVHPSDPFCIRASECDSAATETDSTTKAA